MSSARKKEAAANKKKELLKNIPSIEESLKKMGSRGKGRSKSSKSYKIDESNESLERNTGYKSAVSDKGKNSAVPKTDRELRTHVGSYAYAEEKKMARNEEVGVKEANKQNKTSTAREKPMPPRRIYSSMGETVEGDIPSIYDIPIPRSLGTIPIMQSLDSDRSNNHVIGRGEFGFDGRQQQQQGRVAYGRNGSIYNIPTTRDSEMEVQNMMNRADDQEDRNNFREQQPEYELIEDLDMLEERLIMGRNNLDIEDVGGRALYDKAIEEVREKKERLSMSSGQDIYGNLVNRNDSILRPEVKIPRWKRDYVVTELGEGMGCDLGQAVSLPISVLHKDPNRLLGYEMESPLFKVMRKNFEGSNMPGLNAVYKSFRGGDRTKTNMNNPSKQEHGENVKQGLIKHNQLMNPQPIVSKSRYHNIPYNNAKEVRENRKKNGNKMAEDY